MEKSTKIVATIGPASDSVEIIRKMYESGMNVARLNFSHGSYDYFDKIISNIREVSDKIAILLDTKGPEIRTGEIENGSILLNEGDEMTFTNEILIGNNKILTLNYSGLNKLNSNNRILIDDGLIEAEILETKENELRVKILNGGKLGSKKTVTIWNHSVDIPFLSQKDIDDIKYGIEKKVDFVAASFVREASEVLELKKFLKENGGEKIKVISKIEHAKSVENINDIIEVSQGIMVARGDLGVEMPLEKVPTLQKQILERCNELGRPVIVATQMLESMKDNPRPTRAEVADVAAAIIQGADAVMLSGETASGKYPVKAIQTMAKIANEFDPQVTTTILDNLHNEEIMKNMRISLYVTKSAYHASNEINAKAILTPTESGFTARKVSRFKPKCPIFAISHDMVVIRQLALSWGVYPILDEEFHQTHDGMVNALVKNIFIKGYIKEHERIVVTSGHILGEEGHTNMLEIYKVEHVLRRIP